MSNRQLWYAHYDNNPSFSDFSPFGGWSKPAIKQVRRESLGSLAVSLEIAHEIECGAVRRHHWHLRHLDRQGLLLSNDPGAQLASRLDAIGLFDMAHQSTMNAQSSHSFQSNPISLIHRV